MNEWFDLTDLARQGKLDPVVNRGDMIGRLVNVLLRRTRRNPLLVGEPGVGKTSLVEGLAERIAAGEVPDRLRESRIIALDLGVSVARARASGDARGAAALFVEAIDDLERNSVPTWTAAPSRGLALIVFVDELHLLAGTSPGGEQELTGLLKLALRRDHLAIISETTPEHYERYHRATSLDQHFEVIWVPEANADETMAILAALAPRFAAHHNVEFPEDVVREIAEKASQLPNRALPDKAVDLMDEVSSHVWARPETKPSVGRASNSARAATLEDIAAVMWSWTHGPVHQEAGRPTDEVLT